MGLFFNYDKPGPGVDKNAPKKKGIFLYFELFFRKFWLLIKVNMLYFLVSLPVMAIYNFLILNEMATLLPKWPPAVWWQMSVIGTVILTILWGTGPVTGGFVYILRSYSREEHAWMASDFFEKSKETFKLGMTVLFMDILFLFLGMTAYNVYSSLIMNGHTMAKYALAALFVFFAFYTFMHFYVYELGVTFENKTFKTIKNALIIGIATLPACLLLTIFVLTLSYLAFSRLVGFVILFIAFLFWISFMRFPIDFYAARMLKRRFIDSETEESGDEESGDEESGE